MKASRAWEEIAFRKVFLHIGTFLKFAIKKKPKKTNNNQKTPLNLTKIVVLLMVNSISNCLTESALRHLGTCFPPNTVLLF